MTNKIVHVSKLERRGDYRLKLWFTNGQAGEWDFSELATRSGAATAAFRDPADFDRVFLEMGALTWPDGYDWCPQALHDDMAAAGKLRLEVAASSHIRLPAPVAAIYEAVAELEKLYPGRKFTPDGHLVGSIGEVIAAEALGLELYPASYAGHDARDATGRDVQIKLTGGKSVSLYATCDRLVVLRVVSPHFAEIVYDGFGAPAWEGAGPLQKNGQRTIGLAKFKRIAASGDAQTDSASEVRTASKKRSTDIKLVRAVRVDALPGHRLDVAFSDLSRGVIDLSDWVRSGGPMVQPLADETFFAQVFLEMGTPTWPNGCDVDPTNMRMQLEAAGQLRADNLASHLHESDESAPTTLNLRD